MLCGFGAVELFHVNYFIGTINYFMTIDVMTVYVITFDTGFRIPMCSRRVTESLVLRLNLLPNLTEADVRGMVKRVRSIKCMSIRVGSFHQLQRVSTPTFVDFAIKYIVRIIIAYRRR